MIVNRVRIFIHKKILRVNHLGPALDLSNNNLVHNNSSHIHNALMHHEKPERKNYDNSRNAYLGLRSGMKIDLS